MVDILLRVDRVDLLVDRVRCWMVDSHHLVEDMVVDLMVDMLHLLVEGMVQVDMHLEVVDLGGSHHPVKQNNHLIK